MDDNKRTKILAGALAVILVFLFLKPHEKLMAPITEAKEKLESAEAAVSKAMDKDREVLQAEVSIENAQAASLPPSPTKAMRVYQKWITNLAEQCRFAALQVTPGRVAGNAEKDFITVDVQVEGEIGLEDLTRFLYLFDQADLKHRITSLRVESSGSRGTPRMEVILTAQGISVVGTPSHDDVFPVTTLQEDVEADATRLVVGDAEDFPKKLPFLAQVGTEMVEVTDRDEKGWTVTRGVQGTQATEHSTEESLQAFPFRYQEKPVTFEEYESFVASSPFVKPPVARTLTPRIAGLSDKTIEPGESVSLKVSTVDVDASVGDVTWKLEDAAEGMSLDEQTGEFSWETSAETEAKTYSPKIIVQQKNNDDLDLSKSFNITLKLPNDAPSLNVANEAVVVLGQSFELGLEASDDGDDDSLKFSLEGDVPEGLSVDSSARKLTWIPAKSFTPGEYDVTVKVTDSGDPAKSASESVKLKVQDDTAVYMKLTGAVSLDDEREALFQNQIAGKNSTLRVGDQLEASEISATITEISRRFLLMEDNQGIWKLTLGDTLRERELIEPAESPEPEEEKAEVTDEAENSVEEGEGVGEASGPSSDQPATAEEPVKSSEVPAGESS